MVVGGAEGDMVPGELFLLRHGESTANAAGLFTGSLDVGLTPLGQRQSRRAAALINDAGHRVDLLLTSPMTRARATADLAAEALAGQPPVEIDCRLAERSYGALTGRTKAAVLAEYGTEAFVHWRRSLEGTPPPLTAAALSRLRAQPAFAGCPAEAVAATESLADVMRRVRPVAERIASTLLAGRSLLVVGHGNSLRALIGVAEGLDAAALHALNLPPGQPLRYAVDDAGRPVPATASYLDPSTALPAARRVAREGGT